MSLERGTLQVVNLADVSPVLPSQSVAHQDDVDVLQTLHIQRVDAVDPCKQRLRVLLQVQVVRWNELLHEFEFTFGHSLHDESSIVAEEKEAATFTRGFSRRKDLLTVLLVVE